ncbi:substrate-binding domain-containing protein [Leucobacter sp. CSA1]|uniref:Substrate-binding domain-containing protein n=1 Tax=Leucobacter chromiisoli TaxID=2796471 RepID=A0A934Q9D4_9MICO|nr:ABC transporter substrate-binding protein [Leucobacter chromiisoli]MBK0419049.1 substrate-binding domain-containing protein [Leucobacter chromiisoli]
MKSTKEYEMARVRRWIASAAALAAAAALAGCGASEGTTTGDGETPEGVTIGFVPGIASDPFFVAMQQGAEEHAEELGVELIWQGAPDEYSPQSQIPFVESMITQQVDGLIVVPTDPDALQASVVSAVGAEIPVATVDTTVTDQSALVSHITGDNLDGGRMAGETLAEQIGGEGKVFLMSGSPTATTNTLREQGFREALEEYPDIELVGVEYANSQPANATSAVSTILLEHPDLAGIFAVDGTSGTGTVAALRNAGVVGEIALIGYDAYDNQVADLEAGVYTALVVQKPGEMAALAIDSILAAIDGDTSSVEQEVVMENVVMTKENFDETGQYQYPN